MESLCATLLVEPPVTYKDTSAKYTVPKEKPINGEGRQGQERGCGDDKRVVG